MHPLNLESLTEVDQTTKATQKERCELRSSRWQDPIWLIRGRRGLVSKGANKHGFGESGGNWAPKLGPVFARHHPLTVGSMEVVK